MNSVFSCVFTQIATTTTNFPCNASCINQTWIVPNNRLAQWLFDGSYRDQMNNYNVTPTNTMSFTSNVNGYVKQAIIFYPNANVVLVGPLISLSSTSFTIDAWLYITELVNTYDHGIFGYCSQLLLHKCLHLTIRRSDSVYHLYMGFFHADCEGVTSLSLNTWIHAAFVFDSTTLTQKIYLNGLLEKSCTQSSAITATTTSFTIGYIPLMNTDNGMTYYRVSDFYTQYRIDIA